MPETLRRKITGAPPSEDTDESASWKLQREQIIGQYRGYFEETFTEKHIAGEQETVELKEWMEKQETTEEGVKSLRLFYEGYLRQQLVSGRKLYDDFFNDDMKGLKRALREKWISRNSYDKWVLRFRDSSVGYKAREYWIQHQFLDFMKGWQEAAEEGKKLRNDPAFKALLSHDPTLAKLANEEAFLELHFDARKGLVAHARATILAKEKQQLDLYDEAKRRLQAAEQSGLIGRGKTGVWLERIFKSSASPKKIEQFVRGNDGTSLTTLVGNWHGVRGRYDVIAQKLRERGEGQAPRGLILLNEQQFLSLHFGQRLRYVEQMEDRINMGSDLRAEPDSFIRIRHAMDMKDWEEADTLIQKTEQEPLSEANRERLSSMRRYVTQFRPRQKEGAGGEAVTSAKQRIDELVSRLDTAVQPMILRLLRGPNANRSIHQLRWIDYNNIWCRTRGYLDDELAGEGASKDYRELTKYRAEHGMDIGRHDALDWETADSQYFRKKEFANHKATYIHVNLDSGGVTHALEEWVGHEQPSNVLYWGTLCCHNNGMPKPENWHREFLFILSELRSATKVLKNAGFMYEGPGLPLTSLN
ncbi:MAG: hypothetical protein WC840_02085 [Candidatus Peribacteraceae bacterium]